MFIVVSAYSDTVAAVVLSGSRMTSSQLIYLNGDNGFETAASPRNSDSVL